MKGKKQIGQKKNKAVVVKTGSDDLYNKICILVENSKASIAVAVNRQLTMLYWQIGYLIKHDILQTKKAGYGDPDYCHIVSPINRTIRQRMEQTVTLELSLHCRDFSGRKDYLYSVGRIKLVSSQRNHLPETTPEKRILHRNVHNKSKRLLIL